MSQIAVITGATRGLGRALCDRFVEAGWIVAGCGTRRELVDSLGAEMGASHRFDVVDTTDAVAVEQWAGTVTVSICAPDLLINNAGVINDNAPCGMFRSTIFRG